MLHNFFFSQFQSPRFSLFRLFIFLLILVTSQYTSSDCSADSTPATVTITVLNGGTIIPQTGWGLLFVDSEEIAAQNGAAVNSFDGDVNTIWHTEWFSSDPVHPHEIQIDLGQSYDIGGFRYLPRQNGQLNGTIGQYEFYISNDGVNWGTSVATGTFPSDSTEKEVLFPATTGKFIRLRALTEVNGNPWTSMAEINVLGSLSSGNIAPNGVIDTPIGDQTINVGNSVSFTGTGTDPGVTTFNTAGVFTVTYTVTVSDGKLTDSQDVSIIVLNTNQAPVLDQISDITVNEGDTITFNPTATDPDGDFLTYTFTGLMTSNIYTTNYLDVGTHTVTVTVSDGMFTDSQDVMITVTDISQDPGSQASVSWNANTETDLAGYKVYYGVSSGNYDTYYYVRKEETAYTLSNLTSGETYYIAVTAYDFSGNESSSYELAYYVP